MKKSRRRIATAEEENYWPAFTDIISTISIILFFLMFLMYINNIITGKDLAYLKKEMDDTRLHLEASKIDLSNAENEIRFKKLELERISAEFEKGQIELTLSNEAIEKQREIIASSNQELGDLRQKLQNVALIRLDVLKAVKDSIESQLGTQGTRGQTLVSIGENGNIVINENLVFDRNQYTIKNEGKPLLDQLAIAFERILDDEAIRDKIDAINIQGHTDERGSSDSNRLLGAQRANSVVNYLMAVNPSLESKYSAFFLASSFSEDRPLNAGKTEADYAQNRRIEIGIILKDSEVQKIIDAYLEDSIKIFN